jgi:predicted chitinase
MKTLSWMLRAASLLALTSCELEPGEVAPSTGVVDPTQSVALGLSPGTDTLVRAGSGKCLDVAAAGSGDGTNIQQYACNGTGAQSFRAEDAGGGTFRIVNVPTGKCVDVNARGTADGTNIQLWTCNGTPAQSFRVEDLGGGYTQVVNTNAGKCVDVSANSYNDSANVQLWTCNGTDAQKWSFRTGGGGGGGGGGFVVSEAQFNQMFPGRNGFYTYSGFVAGAGSWPAFAGTGDTTVRKREAAAFLANVDHETGGLYYIEEIVKGPYCGGGCACAPGKQYYGRGPLQLSWNFNYCAAGSALGLDLQADPDLIARDSRVAWATSLWFWMTSSGAGWTTPHNAMVNGNGFGETIRAINGSLECNGANPGSVQNRVSSYLRFCAILGVDPGPNTGC